MNYHNGKRGQAVLLVVVVMGIFLIGALGLAIDVSQLFGQQQMAQVAADAAAQAAMLSIFQGVNTVDTNPAAFSGAPGTSFTCDSTHLPTTPCKYAQMNGFGSGDTITVSFSPCALTGGICGTVAAGQANQVTVVINRSVSNSLIRMVGGSAFTKIGATAIAACLAVDAPVPILILHPNKSGALAPQGGGGGMTEIHIKGGPSRSIQVNSSCTSTSDTPTCKKGTDAYVSLNIVDLSLAGPDHDGADFGVFGGPTIQPPAGNLNLGTKPGKYQQPSSPMKDPLLGIAAPTAAEIASLPIRTAPFTGVSGSFDTAGGRAPECSTGCDMYLPGVYQNGILIGSNGAKATSTAIFQPGVYVVQNGSGGSGFSVPDKRNVYICGGLRVNPNILQPVVGCTPDPVTGDGMLVYNQFSNPTNPGGTFQITASSNASLQGPPEIQVDASGKPILDSSGNPIITRYAGILFFQDRASPANNSEPGKSKPHALGGGGCIELQGTIYITNTLDTINLSKPNYDHYQEVNYHGHPCSGTFLIGEIITDALTLAGGSVINMTLDSMAVFKIQQIALIGGGPHF